MSFSLPSIFRDDAPARSSFSRLWSWQLSRRESRCLSFSNTRSPSSRSISMRQTWAHSPRLALRRNRASLTLQRPLSETQSAPCTKTSSRVSGQVWWMAAISSMVSSLAKTTWLKPNDESCRTFSAVRLSIWVEAWSGMGGRLRLSSRRSCTMSASTWASQSFQQSFSTRSSSWS